jgi:hypothetical protein
MNQTQISINPLSTSCVLKNLGFAIDEIKLVRTINSLNEQVESGGAEQLELGRRRYLISELRYLHKRLQMVRDKVDSG